MVGQCSNSALENNVGCGNLEAALSGAPLLAWLTGTPGIYVFGGLVKHIINSAVHPCYTDIDVMATSPEVVAQLQESFGYKFREASKPGQNPRYLLGKSESCRKIIQLLLVRSDEEVDLFINNAQYDIDRVSLSNHQLHFDPLIDSDAILQGITEKRARRVNDMRNMRLFAPHRHQIEQRHKLKLLRKGFTLID